MPMHLFRLVFVSDAIGVAKDGLLPLIDIIGVSDRNNRRDHLTGVLLRHGGRFLQIVEGARVDLDRLMARISNDRRHENLRVLSDRPVEHRLFPDWPMAQLEATREIEALMAEDLTEADAGRAERLAADMRRSLAVAS